jgi:hypothetical protein
MFFSKYATSAVALLAATCKYPALVLINSSLRSSSDLPVSSDDGLCSPYSDGLDELIGSFLFPFRSNSRRRSDPGSDSRFFGRVSASPDHVRFS